MTASFRDRFHIPTDENQKPFAYFSGHSLGLQPKNTESYVAGALADWRERGVLGHTEGEHPWVPYADFCKEGLAHLVGARPDEVIPMNSLTTNLHLLFSTFYRPTPDRYKILIEADAFCSDHYAVRSQLKAKGFEPEDALIQVEADPERGYVPKDKLRAIIEEHGDQLALIFLGGVNYLNGQVFPMNELRSWIGKRPITLGLDLAHAVGNIPLKLHDWDVDFAMWCHYKYVNGGPGTIGGAFVHQKHFESEDFSPAHWGWWGHQLADRFKMPKEFCPPLSIDAFQLSNPPILQLAALRASLDIFLEARMENLRERSLALTGFLEERLTNGSKKSQFKVITPIDPAQRGSQISIKVEGIGDDFVSVLRSRHGVIIDHRKPDILRLAPAALYNTEADIERLVQAIEAEL